MKARVPGDRTGLAVALAALLGVLVALAALLDLGPFADDELSRGELIAQGDEICARAHDAFTELQREQPRTAGEAEELTDNLVGIAEDEYDEIDALDGPDDLDQALDEYLDAREQGIVALREGHDAAADRDTATYADLQAEVAGGQEERLKLARRVGFRECSRRLEPR